MPYKVVVIDDSSIQRLATSILIKNHPQLEFIGAYGCPYEGMKAFVASDADIIFMDVLLEDVNAFDIMEKIQLHAAIVINSTWSRFEERANEAGMEHFLLKPIRKSNFEVAINKVISSLEQQTRSNQTTLDTTLPSTKIA